MDPDRAEQRLRRLLDGLFSFVGLLDPEGVILEANQTALDGIDLRRKDVIGRPFWETPWWEASPEVRAQLRDAIVRARGGETVRYDVETCLAGDVRVTMDFQLVPLIEDGEVTGLVPSGIDVTDRRNEGARLLASAEFARALAVAAHTTDVADAVRTHLAVSFGASFASLALLDPSSQMVHVLQPEDLDPDISDRYTDLPLDASTPLTDAIRSGETVVVDNPAVNVRRYPHLAADTVAAGLAATASIPLREDGEVQGAIGLGWTRPLAPDTSFWARLDAVADLTASTLARTRTSDTHAEFIDRVHAQMVSTETPEDGLEVAVRYEPAGRGLGFGGDWYDIIPLGGARTAVVVGDVVGHGIEAAAKMVVVRSALKAVAQLDTPVEDIIRLASPMIDGPKPAFVGTAVVLVVDTAQQCLTYSSAGHPPALVIQPDGRSQLLDEANGIVLGYPDRKPLATSVPFPPGALAVAYTDGLVESRSAGIDEGIERLRAAAIESSGAGLDADELVVRLVASAGGIDDLEDDVAIVVLRHRTERTAA